VARKNTAKTIVEFGRERNSVGRAMGGQEKDKGNGNIQ
jgi:hypothetical protein